MHKILKTACGDNVIGKQTSDQLFQFKRRGTLVEAYEHSSCPYTGQEHKKSVPPGQMVKQNYYWEVLQ
jgi:hypothetical protein